MNVEDTHQQCLLIWDKGYVDWSSDIFQDLLVRVECFCKGGAGCKTIVS